MATDPTALLYRKLFRWLLLGVEFPLNPAEFLFGVACHDLTLASTLAEGKDCWGLVVPSLGGPAQKRFGDFGGFTRTAARSWSKTSAKVSFTRATTSKAMNARATNSQKEVV